MFDIGFTELALVLVVALVVVGPERLPRLVRTAGLYLGRARRAVGSIKADVQRELAAEELKQTLKEQGLSIGLHEIVEETRDAVKSAEQHLNPDPPAVPDTLPDPKPTTAPGSQHGGD